MEIGRVCIKIAGRDAGKKCIVIDKLDDTFVLVDGETRRKKCNIRHLEPTKELVKVEKGASHEEVCKILSIKEVKKTSKPQKEKQPVTQKKVKSETKPSKKKTA